MAILDVLTWPAKVLETKAEPVKKFDDGLRKFVKDMFETMTDSGGIGLAANQVGDLRRVIVVEILYSDKSEREGSEKLDPDVREWWHDKKFTFINPEIVKREGKIKWQEGCLSFPEVFDFVDRSEKVQVKAFDENGKEFTVDANGLFAVCLQHEIDHIDGVVFFQRMSRLKASTIKKKMLRRPGVNEMATKEKSTR